MYKCILASGSPRRQEILGQCGVCFDIVPSKKEEKTKNTEPELVVKELALVKAEDIFRKCASEDCIVIGADTIVTLDNKILGKPKDEEEAFSMLKSIQGRSHDVYTGVAIFILKGDETKCVNFAEATKVNVREMSDQMIREYVLTGEPADKAGGYGIQGAFAPFVESIEGDYYNVVGLPISKIYYEMLNCGIDLKKDCLI